MKLLITVIIIAMIIMLNLGCGSSEKSDSEKFVKKMVISEHPEILSLLQRSSEAKIANFMYDLKWELVQSMQSGGPINAIDVCSESAPEIAMKNAATGWDISRVTDKSRNPNNLADSLELTILDRFQKMDSLPNSIYIWKDSTYYHFKPIIIGEVCLNCHGSKDQLTDGLAEKLFEMYPEDKALDYKVGDFRGMFVVEIEWPLGKAHAEELTAE